MATHSQIPDKPPPLDAHRLSRIRECQGYLDRLKAKYRDDKERMHELTSIGAYLVLIEGDESW